MRENEDSQIERLKKIDRESDGEREREMERESERE